jgi:hypothetical protein
MAVFLFNQFQTSFEPIKETAVEPATQTKEKPAIEPETQSITQAKQPQEKLVPVTFKLKAPPGAKEVKSFSLFGEFAVILDSKMKVL